MAAPPSSLLHLSPPVADLRSRLEHFVRTECQPAEVEFEEHLSSLSGADRWKPAAVPPCVERLKSKARSLGLWNLFLPRPLPPSVLDGDCGVDRLSPPLYLTNREYGLLCESMGRSFLAPEATNCSAPDTGNMEVLLQHGSPDQQRRYLRPLLDGTMRSAFLMTEPDVASSDATNVETGLTKIVGGDGSKGGLRYVLNGRKWWSTGAMDPRCGFFLVLARMDYSHPSCKNGRHEKEAEGRKEKDGRGGGGGGGKHGAHTVVLVPSDAPGVELVRPLTVFGYDDAPHGHAEVALNGVTVDASCLILGEGRGFEIAQSRLGPGRVHHCMRAVGMAARCYELMLERSLSRRTFGKALWEHGGCQEMIADSASDLEAARLLTLSCAAAIDGRGPRGAAGKIASIKVAVPELCYRVADRAVQVHGGAGVSGDLPLARILAGLRTLRIADGPDAVHRRTVARLEIRKAREALRLSGRSRL